MTPRTTRHYRMGSSTGSACGLKGLDHRALAWTRDPRVVTCARCRVVIVAMARDWSRIPDLAEL